MASYINASIRVFPSHAHSLFLAATIHQHIDERHLSVLLPGNSLYDRSLKLIDRPHAVAQTAKGAAHQIIAEFRYQSGRRQFIHGYLVIASTGQAFVYLMTEIGSISQYRSLSRNPTYTAVVHYYYQHAQLVAYRSFDLHPREAEGRVSHNSNYWSARRSFLARALFIQCRSYTVTHTNSHCRLCTCIEARSGFHNVEHASSDVHSIRTLSDEDMIVGDIPANDIEGLMIGERDVDPTRSVSR